MAALKLFCMSVFTALAMAPLSPADARPCRPGAAACYEKVRPPVVHRTIRNRYVLDPGVYEVARTPSLYGWRKRRVLLEGGYTVWRHAPAEYRSVSVTKKVAGGYKWEYRDINGRQVLCKIKLAPRTLTYDKKILISRGKRWAERREPVYGYREDRILLRQYKNIATYHRPYLRHTRERAVIQPEGYSWRRISGSLGF